MKRFWLSAVALLLASPLSAAPAPDAVTGFWLTAAEDGYVQVFERDGVYHGRIVGSPDGQSRRDEHNPDRAKRDRSLLGVRILEGFEYDGEGQWIDGRAYDPNNGKTYDAKMWLEGADTLKLRGYIGMSLFGRTATWTRVAADAEGIQPEALRDTGETD